MNVLTNFIVVIISQCKHTLNLHALYHMHVICLFYLNTAKKKKKTVKKVRDSGHNHGKVHNGASLPTLDSSVTLCTPISFLFFSYS